MAPAPLKMSAINHKRAISLETFHSGGLTTSGKAAIGCASTVLVLFIIGLGFFIYFYVTAVRHREPAHLGPFAFSQKTSTAGLAGTQTISEKQSFGNTSANSSSAEQQPAAVPLVDTPPGTSEQSTPKQEGADLLNPRPRLHQLDEIPQLDHRTSQASQQSTSSLEHPPIPGSEFV